MTTASPFRAEALAARRPTGLGPIVMVSPPSHAAWTAGAVAMALAVVLLFAFGSHARRVTVQGRLLPTGGVVKVHAPQTGVVARRLVDEGAEVAQGQLLLELRSPVEDLQGAVSARVRERERALEVEAAQTQLLQQQEQQSMRDRAGLLAQQLRHAEAQIASQRERVALAGDAVARQRALVEQGFVSRDTLQARQADALEQATRLQGLERERQALVLERDALANQGRELGYRQAVRRAELQRERSLTAQELVESESRRHWTVTAPQAGTVTAVLAQPGQVVDTARPLMSIVPQGARLQAQLYAPSRAIGFVQPGDPVRLRYAAYPYQNFGQAQAVVAEVARTALLPSELDEGPAPATGEPLYRITATLASQQMQAHGRPWPLQPGMALEADVLQERRRLYEWVLEPLLGLRHKLAPAAR